MTSTGLIEVTELCCTPLHEGAIDGARADAMAPLLQGRIVVWL
jgi:hypothetical protein